MRFPFAHLQGALLLLAMPAAADGLSPEARVGRKAMEKAQCTRCHAVTDLAGQGRGLPPHDRSMHCVDCHTWILGTRGDEKAIAEQREVFPDWDRYLDNIVHFTRLPDLGTLTRRVGPAFVRTFLDAPFDLSPHLAESMIPVRLSAPEKDAVVAYLAELNAAKTTEPPPVAAAPSPDALALGRGLFAAKGCVVCHVVGNETLIPGFDASFYAALARPDNASRLAPNLRFVRDRMQRASLVEFIRDPAAFEPETPMPKVEMTAAEAGHIADFLLHAPFSVPSAKAAAPDVPLLGRKVSFDEVYDEVLGRICVHCHMDPASNNGDGGAGNTGGLGWNGAGLNLETYEGVKRGVVVGMKRVSVIEADGDKPPRLFAALVRRHSEAARDVRGPMADAETAGPPTPIDGAGMPLGLPPLPMAQMQLVRTWLAQGAPGPKTQ